MKHRKANSHKGDNGVVVCVGGSKEYVGGIYFAGLAALRSGVDLVYVAAPEKVAWAINSMNPDLMTVKLKGDYVNAKHSKQIGALLKKADVLLIGPALGLQKETSSFVKRLIESTNIPKIIDADAVKVMGLKKVNNAILTPHQKEFKILLKNSKLNEKNYRKHLGSNVLLLKGPVDKIVSRNKVALNKTGNAGMTVGGTGDILAGLCAGFVAQGIPLFPAACKAAYVNGRIGDKLKKKLGYGFISSDFLKVIAEETKKHTH